MGLGVTNRDQLRVVYNPNPEEIFFAFPTPLFVTLPVSSLRYHGEDCILETMPSEAASKTTQASFSCIWSCSSFYGIPICVTITHVLTYCEMKSSDNGGNRNSSHTQSAVGAICLDRRRSLYSYYNKT